MKFTAMEYVEDVLSGKQVACKWVRLACERHVKDLKTGKKRGLYFDETAAKTAIAFFYLLNHSKGEWAGKPLSLEPWQQFFIWNLFGWKRKDGTRRFRTAYQEVARKNGKTTIAAGIGLYLLAADGEPGAEIYTAATKRDQARIAHGEATRMVKASKPLKKMIRSFKDNLHIEDTASKFEPLGKDADSMDGLNVHGAIVDEVHAHKTREVWDKLETATGARRQPIMLGITTAGFDRQSLCYQLNEYTQKILSGIIVDDSFFGIIFTLDEGDNWEDENVWVKANPNLGVSKKWDDMRRKAKRAKDMPAALNAFLRLELNIWTQSVTRWVNQEKWDLCADVVDPDLLAGAECYGGLDLSSNIDLSAWIKIFPPESANGIYKILCHFWIPEDNIEQRVKRDRVPYDVWVREGYITATPGNVIDYDFILAQIDQDAEDFDLREIAFDRWGATKIQTQLLDHGHTIVKFGQGFASMSGPMKEFEKLILAGKLAHGGNPVLTWMADNLVVREDPAGNIKPDKEKSREKIDGMVGAVMALDRAIRHEGGGKSVYKDRGLVTI